MSVWQIFLLYFLKFGTLDSFPFYQQLSLLGMECGNSITSHIISGSTKIVKSRIECAAHCLITTGCGTILFDNKIEYGQKGFCTLVTESSPVSIYVLKSNLSVCFMKKASVKTTQSTPTETTITPTTSSTTLTKTTQSTSTPTTTNTKTTTTPVTTTLTSTLTTMTTMTPTTSTTTTNTLTTSTPTTTTSTPATTNTNTTTTPTITTTTPTTTTETTSTSLTTTTPETTTPTISTTTTIALTTPTPTTTTKTTTTTLTPTTSATTTPTTTTTSIGETIIDVIDNLSDMCNMNSPYGKAIVTTNGVYFYADAVSLTTGACRNMTNAELFQGFAFLPDKSTWEALLTYTNTYIDLFTDAGQVYRWSSNKGNLDPESGFPKTKQAYIAGAVYYTPTNIFSGAHWSVYTQITGGMTLYFFDASTGTIYYHNNQQPHEGSFLISDTTNVDNYGRPLNLWYNLPSNVAGVTEQDTWSKRFIVVDVNLNVYFYDIQDPYDVNTYPPVCSLQGQLRL